jgi:ribosome biogenesis protein MAK21
VKPGLRALITQPEEDDDDEHFEDAPDSDDEESSKSKNAKGTVGSSTNNNIYDGRKRDPRYANADKTCLWELVSCRRFTFSTASYHRNQQTNPTYFPPLDSIYTSLSPVCLQIC